MSRLKAAYQEMYLVTKTVYQKVLDCIDETSRRDMEELNRPDDDDFDERRPSEDFFGDMAYQDIEGGVRDDDTRIQEAELRTQEHFRGRQLRPMLTYEPDLPPIKDVLKPPGSIPTLSKSTYPRLFYYPSKQLMEKQSEIIRQAQRPLPPPRGPPPTLPSLPSPPKPPRPPMLPRPQRPLRDAAYEYDDPSYSTESDVSFNVSRRPRYYSESQSEYEQPRTSTPIPHSSRQRPPVKVSYQEGLETIQDCARGINTSICRSQQQQLNPKRGGYQCELCNKILATKHNLNRHMNSVHKSVNRSRVSESEKSFAGWEDKMETAALPERRKRGAEEYETDEDIPLSQIRMKKRQVAIPEEDEPEGSGRKDSFESWK